MTSPDLDRLGTVRTDWSLEEARALFALPFNDLLYHAQRVHRLAFDPNRVQVSTLLSIKTGACPEDCAYCPQSVRYETGVGREELLDLREVIEAAEAARRSGATRFCMGAAYRNPKPKQLEQIKAMVREWERQYPGRTDNMLHAMGHVVRSHLMDPRLYPFAELKPSGVPDQDGDKAFDDDEGCASPAGTASIPIHAG